MVQLTEPLRTLLARTQNLLAITNSEPAKQLALWPYETQIAPNFISTTKQQKQSIRR